MYEHMVLQVVCTIPLDKINYITLKFKLSLDYMRPSIKNKKVYVGMYELFNE